MSNFRLNPGDILVNVNRGKDPLSVIKRWGVGPYSHVFMYLGRLILTRAIQTDVYREIPMLFESSGRGVVLQSLSNRYGQEVVVLRLKSEHDKRRIPYVLEEAIKLASDPQSFYDYSVIVQHIIPKLILEKLHLPIPLQYDRDKLMICSEAVFEVFYRAKLVDILPESVVPLPGDFVTSLLLDEVWRGELSEDLLAL